MSKAVISRIKADSLPNFVGRVDNDNAKNLKITVAKIAEECPDTVVLVMGVSKDENTLLVALYTPPRAKEHITLFNEFLVPALVENISTHQFETVTESIQFAQIDYPELSEYYSGKVADVVAGNAFRVLQRFGLYEPQQSDDEPELTFDDI